MSLEHKELYLFLFYAKVLAMVAYLFLFVEALI